MTLHHPTNLVIPECTDCKVTLTHTLGSAWTSNGQDYSQWSVAITNSGSEQVKSLELSIQGNLDQLWELKEESSGSFLLPDYVVQGGGIAVGKSHNFGYIIKSKQQATIEVEDIDCQGAAASPSSSTSPAASPATSPAASPSPSTVVSSPQPSPVGCSVSVTQAIRPEANGGKWTEGDYSFQIFDLTISNTGRTPVDAVRISIVTDATIYQFWNLQREDSTANFNVPTPWGPIQVGASQGAGYIIRYRTGTTYTGPVVTVISSSCSGSPTAAPSTAPSSAASPSPSTIVSTPQPVGCKADISVVARSASSGGSWTDNNGNNQIFDITITNSGNLAIKGGELTVSLASGQTIVQFWELNRKDSTHFAIPTTYGPIQVGASQGAGIIVASQTAPVAKPTISITALTCN